MAKIGLSLSPPEPIFVSNATPYVEIKPCFILIRYIPILKVRKTFASLWPLRAYRNNVFALSLPKTLSKLTRGLRRNQNIIAV